MYTNKLTLQLYTQLQKKPVIYVSGQIWKAELRNENICLPCSLTISTASIQ